MATARRRRPQVPFPHKLVLHQWMLSLLGVDRLEQLSVHLRHEGAEGLDQNNVHRFHHALIGLVNLTELTTGLLREYDQNIVKHTQRLNEHRITRGEEPIVWKYFQYLALLFTEIYLDRYFADPVALRAALNAQIEKWNVDKPEADQLGVLDTKSEAWTQLNKLAFWVATGGGKTLVMHANILQFRHYLAKHGRQRELNRIILLTPNEGLSQQHLREFDTAGIAAEIFSKDKPGLFTKQGVEILEITRLREEAGEKTVAVDAFEGSNLVLVDEGHRGTSGGGEGSWMTNRDKLCAKGFSFEYSATFGQAVKGDAKLTDRYAKNILFDYSYRYFYGDGFGKDYQILNLDEDTQRDHQEPYLVACLLSFFQQQRLYREHASAFRPFQIEKPLWVFVGSSVTATLAKQDASDIVEILQFFARFVADRGSSIQRIDRVLNQGLITSTNQNLFAGRFQYLNTLRLTATQVFEEILTTLFHAPGGGHLYVEDLKGASGEIALRIGAENEEFGVINVGEASKLVKLCAEKGLLTGSREFLGSLFHGINEPASPVNLLIGSKKFTEGWSSWRVSTMGLMNVGVGEGAQIIQLFGRGVRLKGYGKSLKRSVKAQLPEGVERPKHIGLLETLGIFGIHANYMAQFRAFLEQEGLPTSDDRIEILMPVIKNLGTQQLKTVRLKKSINGVTTDYGHAFRRLGPVPTIKPPDSSDGVEAKNLQKTQVVLNWYPKIQAMKSGGLVGGDSESAPNSTHLAAHHVAFLDLDRLYFELERFKAERGWHNLNITRSGIQSLLADPSWYELLIPAEQMEIGSFDNVRTWEEIALALLKNYTDRYYTFRKREWEMPHLEYRDLEASDPNFLVKEGIDEGYYRILIDRSQEEIVAKLNELKAAIERGVLKDWSFRELKAICFGRHLYEPLLCLDGDLVEISPTPLNSGERKFVEDLRTFHDANTAYFKGRELYLLRNLSRGRGVGFFEAGNFHPDFILWVLVGKQQHVIFVDPKGIQHLDPGDPKVEFHDTIKDIERRLGNGNVRLESFIVSNTASHTMKMRWRMDKAEMNKRHILFQAEDKDSYVKTMLGG